MNQDMREWLEKGKKINAFVNRLSELVDNPKVDYEVGNVVTFTNGYGVEFHNLKIIAIGRHSELWECGHCIYLDKESYWYPVKPDSLKLESSDEASSLREFSDTEKEDRWIRTKFRHPSIVGF